MTVCELEQRIQRLARVPPARTKALGDEGAEVGVAEGTERHRVGLTEERTLASGEERLHHARLGSREDVAGELAVVLDVTAQDPVDAIELQHLVELVEGDDEALAAAGEDVARQVEQAMQRR